MSRVKFNLNFLVVRILQIPVRSANDVNDEWGNGFDIFPHSLSLSRTLSLKSWDLADFVLIKLQIVNKARQFHITLVLTFNYLHPVHGN